jgi:hypothetical protein
MMGSAKISLECGPLVAPTAATIDQIARLKLAARRQGCALELKNAAPCLLELIGFCGLGEVLGVELQRQAEQRKQSLGVEEEGELGDLTVS